MNKAYEQSNGMTVNIILNSMNCGGDEIPPGTFHGGDEIPSGTFHGTNL